MKTTYSSFERLGKMMSSPRLEVSHYSSISPKMGKTIEREFNTTRSLISNKSVQNSNMPILFLHVMLISAKKCRFAFFPRQPMCATVITILFSGYFASIWCTLWMVNYSDWKSFMSFFTACITVWYANNIIALANPSTWWIFYGFTRNIYFIAKWKIVGKQAKKKNKNSW